MTGLNVQIKKSTKLEVPSLWKCKKKTHLVSQTESVEFQ